MRQPLAELEVVGVSASTRGETLQNPVQSPCPLRRCLSTPHRAKVLLLPSCRRGRLAWRHCSSSILMSQQKAHSWSCPEQSTGLFAGCSGGSLLDHNQTLQASGICYCQRVCDLHFTSEVTVNIHSDLKKCWSLCQERRIKTETTECRPKVGGSGEHFNEKNIKFSSYFYSQPGRNSRSQSFFPCYIGLPTATEANFKVGAKPSCLHYSSWCFSLRWFCFKLWAQTSCLQCFPFLHLFVYHVSEVD